MGRASLPAGPSAVSAFAAFSAVFTSLLLTVLWSSEPSLTGSGPSLDPVSASRKPAMRFHLVTVGGDLAVRHQTHHVVGQLRRERDVVEYFRGAPLDFRAPDLQDLVHRIRGLAGLRDQGAF